MDHKNKVEPFTLFMLHHAAQKKPQQASIKIKVIKIRKKLQDLCMTVVCTSSMRGLGRKAQTSSLMCKQTLYGV
jgi:hypothetical protein